MTKKIVKKMILVLRYGGLNELDKLKLLRKIQKANAVVPLVVPGLNPAAGAVGTMLDDAQGYLDSRTALELQIKQLTGQFHDKVDSVIDIYINKWMSQTLAVINNDPNVAKSLGWGVKNEIETQGQVKEYELVIVKVETNVHGQHTVHFLDGNSGKKALPPGVLRIDVYGQTGGTQPADLTALIANGGGYLGQATKAVFVEVLPTGNTGKTEYYIGAYVGKKTKKPVAQSVVFGAPIT